MCVAHRLKNLHRQNNASMNETSFLSQSFLDGLFSLLHVIISPLCCLSIGLCIFVTVDYVTHFKLLVPLRYLWNGLS